MLSLHVTELDSIDFSKLEMLQTWEVTSFLLSLYILFLNKILSSHPISFLHEMKYNLVKSLYNSTESARTLQMLLAHLGHSHSQITVYVPAKRGPFYETKVLRVRVRSLNTWRRRREPSRSTQPPNTTEVWSMAGFVHGGAYLCTSFFKMSDYFSPLLTRLFTMYSLHVTCFLHVT